LAAIIPSMCVIIAAFDAQRTIARAVGSALRQDEVAEVLVVDDASSDQTIAAARSADDGSGRLKIVRFDVNGGPAAARNAAIASSSAPFLAILDADDFLLPGRFSRLLAVPDWDIIADNIVFVKEDAVPRFDPRDVRQFPETARTLRLHEFVTRNISQRGRKRGELGFLKPVIRRDLLQRTMLRYDETLRLGEDYILYCRALAAGARFQLVKQCGYVAVERQSSLSGLHRAADLDALAAADGALLALPGLPAPTRRILRRHRRQLLAKVDHRRLLDARREKGIVQAMLEFAARPLALAGVSRSILRDKLEARHPIPDAGDAPLRYLFD
jgi:succinoglycan biosynthesis protein ExoU